MGTPEHEPQPRFVIEPMKNTDIEAATLMRLESWLDTYVNEEAGVTKEWIEERNARQLSADRQASRRERFASGKKAGAFNAWVARDPQGEIIGSTTPYIDAEGRQHLGSLYVDKKWQGTGVAGQLFDEVVQWLDPTKPIELGVTTYNERAKAFYRKQGFIEQPGTEHLFEGVMPEVQMIRPPQEEL